LAHRSGPPLISNVRPLKDVIANIIRVIVLASVAMASMAAEPTPHSYTPKDGFVPNESAAIAIAIAVWVPIYGAEAISKQRPYTATLVNGTWIVEGSLRKQMAGGVARAEIAKKDGRILRVTHGQ
jgi:hypothetical protein